MLTSNLPLIACSLRAGEHRRDEQTGPSYFRDQREAGEQIG
jgi:hypothetical protein